MQRKVEVAGIRARYPNKIPIIVERDEKDPTLPVLNKIKFLVTPEITMSAFVNEIRNRLQLQSTGYFLVTAFGYY